MIYEYRIFQTKEMREYLLSKEPSLEDVRFFIGQSSVFHTEEMMAHFRWQVSTACDVFHLMITCPYAKNKAMLDYFLFLEPNVYVLRNALRDPYFHKDSVIDLFIEKSYVSDDIEWLLSCCNKANKKSVRDKLDYLHVKGM